MTLGFIMGSLGAGLWFSVLSAVISDKPQILLQFDALSEGCQQDLHSKQFNFKIIQALKGTKRTQLNEKLNMDFLHLL